MYETLGFSAIPEDRFAVFINRAGFYVQERTLGRCRWGLTEHPPPSNADASSPYETRKDVVENIPNELNGTLKSRNILGICEIADLFFRSEAAVGENGAAIISFSNEGYRETYEGSARGGSLDLFSLRLTNIMAAYFSVEQLSRRMFQPC